jgi:hypothetical protein
MSEPVEITGADIIGALLREDPAVTATVAIDRIKGGRLPDDVQLPALLVRTISSVERQSLRRDDLVRTTDRVSVTVRAASYDDQINVIGAVRRCCADRTGDFAGGLRVAILTAGTGPDLAGPADAYEQAQDFRVSFDKAG